MTQVTINITKNVKQIIQDMAENENKSFSRVCSDLIDRGLTQSNIQLAIREVGLKNNKYLIQILNIVGEIFYKVHGNNSGHFKEDASPEAMLNQIKSWADSLSNSNFRD